MNRLVAIVGRLDEVDDSQRVGAGLERHNPKGVGGLSMVDPVGDVGRGPNRGNYHTIVDQLQHPLLMIL